MVYPVSGPHYKFTQRFGSPNLNGSIPTIFEKVQVGYRQAKPYDIPLPYDATTTQVTAFSSDNGYDIPNVSWSENAYSDLKTWAKASAYERFKDSVGESADLGITLAEWKSSLDMIYQRAKHARDVIWAVRRGQPGKAAENLFKGFTGDPRQFRGASSPADYGRALKAGTKSVSNFWLETWFGWLPLLSDIGSAVDTLQSPLPYRLAAQGTAKMTRVRSYLPDVVYYGPENLSSIRQGVTYKHVAKHKYCAELRVTNPNLYLANQLGVVNPAVVAWELVTFSFVADWFINVGQFLSACTDFLGLELFNAYENTKYEIFESSYYVDRWRTWLSDPDFVWVWNQRSRSMSRKQTTFKRTIGVTSPPLHWKEFKLPWQRAATACALVGQRL